MVTNRRIRGAQLLGEAMWRLLTYLTVVSYLAAQDASAVRLITTIAGVDYTFPARTLPALQAPLGDIAGLAVDGSGNILLADASNQMIFRLSRDGIVTAIAGSGFYGLSGDGGAAERASLNIPQSVAVDAMGNIFIGDNLNARIRQVSREGVLFTRAGIGFLEAGAGPGSQAMVIKEVAADAAGNVYIADGRNMRILKLSPSNVLSVIAGSGSRGFSGDGGAANAAALNFEGEQGGPTSASGSSALFSGIALDTAGNVYLADTNNDRVRRISPEGIITTVAGNGTTGFGGDGGTAINASLNHPFGVAVDASNNLYIADTLNNRVRRVSPDGVIRTVAGNGLPGSSPDGTPALSASFDKPARILPDAGGALIIVDGRARTLRRIGADGRLETIAGTGSLPASGDGIPATSATLARPRCTNFDSAGNLYLAEAGSHRIRRISPSGVITTVAGNGLRGYSGDGGPALQASLDTPTCSAVDRAGNLYIADSGNERVRVVLPNGLIRTIAGGGQSLADGPSTSAYLFAMDGMAVDPAGNIYVGLGGNVRRISPAGLITTIAGGGTLEGRLADGKPATSAKGIGGFVLDPAGNLYITHSDTTHYAEGFVGDFLSRVGPDGVLQVLAGGIAISPRATRRMARTSPIPHSQPSLIHSRWIAQATFASAPARRSGVSRQQASSLPWRAPETSAIPAMAGLPAKLI